MKTSFAVIGLGRFGLGIVEELSKMGADVIAIDSDSHAVERASKFVSYAVVTDSTNEVNLKELGIANVTHAVVAIGSNLQATILTTAILNELGVKKITVRLDNDYYEKTILKLGATSIVYPEKAGGNRLARSIISDSFVDYFKISDDHNVVQMAIKDDFPPITLVDLNSRNRFDVNVVLIVRDKKSFIPKGTDLVKPGDNILVIGKDNNLRKFENYLNK